MLLNFFRRFGMVVLALAVTALFLYPGLRSGGASAGYLYTGDILNFWWPTLKALFDQYAAGVFSINDLAQFNGASDLAFIPNSFSFYPPFVIGGMLNRFYSLSFESIGFFIVIIIWLNLAFCFFYTYKLTLEIFKFSLPVSIFCATIFIFSTFTVSSLGQPIFITSVYLMPMITYYLINYCRNLKFSNLVISSAAIIISLLGGYPPVAAAMLVLSIVLTISGLLECGFFKDDLWTPLKRLTVPLILALIILFPWIVGSYLYYKLTPSGNVASLFFSAHQLAELPQTFGRILSNSIVIEGPLHQFSLHWGLIPFAIVCLYLGSINTKIKNSGTYGIGILVAVYLLLALSIYGDHSVISDLIFYFVPQIGSMHIYQRFLVPGNLLFAIVIGFCFYRLTEDPPIKTLKVFASLTITVLVFLSLDLSHQGGFAKWIRVDNRLIFELILLTIFLVVFLVAPRAPVIYLTSFLVALPALNLAYDYSKSDFQHEAQKIVNPYILDKAVQNEVVTYLKANSNKALVRYADLTPMWNSEGRSHFPKTFPYFVSDSIKLSSLHGFNFYLSPYREYMSLNQVRGAYELHPDVSYARAVGVDFLIYLKSQGSSARIAAFKPFMKENLTRQFPGGILITPLNFSNSNLYDNGVFRIQEPESAFEIASIDKPSTQSSISYNAPSSRVFDGNKDGVFSSGTTNHTEAELSPWVQVDLTAVKKIDRIRIFNRSDCCSDRLDGYTVFVSKAPISPIESFQSLKMNPTVLSFPGLDGGLEAEIPIKENGRYVRVQLNPKVDSRRILHLAEVEVIVAKSVSSSGDAKNSITDVNFSSNFAGNSIIEFTTTGEMSVRYLPWVSNYSNFILNGSKITIGSNSSAIFEVPSGRHRLEVKRKYSFIDFTWILLMTFVFFVSMIFLYLLRRNRVH
jgi:hypothetical protein